MAGLADLANSSSMFGGINDSNSMFGSSSGYKGVDSMYEDIANTNTSTPTRIPIQAASIYTNSVNEKLFDIS